MSTYYLHSVTVMFPISRIVRNVVSRRCIATVTQAEREASVEPTDTAYEQARAFKQIPKVNTLKALYQLTFTERKSKINEVCKLVSLKMDRNDTCCKPFQ